MVLKLVKPFRSFHPVKKLINVFLIDNLNLIKRIRFITTWLSQLNFGGNFQFLLSYLDIGFLRWTFDNLVVLISAFIYISIYNLYILQHYDCTDRQIRKFYQNSTEGNAGSEGISSLYVQASVSELFHWTRMFGVLVVN